MTGRARRAAAWATAAIAVADGARMPVSSAVSGTASTVGPTAPSARVTEASVPPGSLLAVAAAATDG